MNVLVAAWIGSTNLGDELIARSLFEKLRSRGAAVVAMSLRPVQTRQAHGVEAVGHIDLLPLLRSYGHADRLVFGGGGLLQDETSFWNIPYQTSRLWLARLLQVPFGVVGVGATPLQTGMFRSLVRSLASSARTVAVRDVDSAEALKSLGIREVIVSADLALGRPPVQVPHIDRLVVSLRPSLSRQRLIPVGLRRRGGWASERWITSMATALDEACQATGLTPHFVALQPDRDHWLHEAVAARMTTGATQTRPTIDNVVEEIASGAVVVAMRYHAAIGAVLAGRPTVLISYSAKMDALASDLGPGAALLPNGPGAFARLGDAIESVSHRADAVIEAREKLRQRERGNDTALDLLLEGT